MALVRRCGSSKRELTLLRSALIAEINSTSEALIRDALSCIQVLKGSYYDIEPPSDEDDPIGQLGFDMVPPTSSAPEVLSLALALRSTPARQQFLVMELFEADEKLDNSEHALHSRSHERWEGDLANLREAVSVQRIRVQKLSAGLDPKTRVLTEDKQYKFPQALRNLWALPVEVPREASDAQLLAIAKWTRTAGTSMYCPLSLDESSDSAKFRAFRQAWNQYKECGRAFALLSAWTKSLAATAEGRRCQTCYRHVGAGMKHFCAEHKRTAVTPRDARQLHVSCFYKPLASKDIGASRRLSSRLYAWDLSQATLSRMGKVAVEQGIHSELVQPAAVLATVLRTLRPYVRPAVTRQLQWAFTQMVQKAQEPFMPGLTGSVDELRKQQQGREVAPLWLSWENLVLCVFGATASPLWVAEPIQGRGLDLAHPVIESQSVLPSKLVVDLLHLGAWETVVAEIDKYLYLNPRALLKLRKGDDSTGRPALSLAQIGREVGASHEAVRQNLALAEGKPSKLQGGVRAISGGAERLRQRLGIDA
jgi:hypothetical protein